MALKPVLKQKVDELFLRWLSDNETQQLLKTNLRQILKGEPLTYAAPGLHVANNNSLRHLKPQSPRARPGSPSTPPCSPSIASPRSPRVRGQNNRSLFSRHNKVVKDKEGVNSEREAVTALRHRGEPDGEANSFLRQKEAQLREKREREQRQKEKIASVGSDQNSTDKVVTPASTTSKPVVANVSTGDSELGLEAKGIKKKDGLLATALSSLKNQQNQVVSSSGPKVKVVPQVAEPEPSPPATNGQAPQKTQQSTHRQDANKSVSKTSSPSQGPSQPATLKGAPQKDASKSTSQPPVTIGNSPQVQIPQFYFPMGRPKAAEDLEHTAQKIKEAFIKVEGGKAQKQDMASIAKACGFPMYWKCPLFVHAGGEKSGHVTLQSFLAAWKKLVTSFHDDASRFMKIMAGNKTYLEEDDFLPLVQDVVDTHPGLSFLQDAPEFHSRYVQTVISRIMYCVNRSWSGRVTTTEIRRSALLPTLQVLEEEEDINQVTEFFSYEHFYVIYCKFWELDKDHDLFISAEDLARHNDHALSLRMIDRIFSGAVTRNLSDNKMVYKDFVWFLISEEDKRHPTSVEYWFRCMDLDGDGVVSMYEMEYFYEEQVQKMEALGIETLPFEDCLCQMLDMIKPAHQDSISLQDLRRCKLTPIFFDTFFNLEKYLEHEQKDPFASTRDPDGEDVELSDWEKYAGEEYEVLVAEEGANEEINYEDDFEPDDDLLSPARKSADNGEIMRLSDPPQKRTSGGMSATTDDIYDFTGKDNLGY